MEENKICKKVVSLLSAYIQGKLEADKYKFVKKSGNFRTNML